MEGGTFGGGRLTSNNLCLWIHVSFRSTYSPFFFRAGDLS